MNNRKCKCGFQFSGPGEFRNCEAFVNAEGRGGIICPECHQAYIDGELVTLKLPEVEDGA